MVDTRFVSPEFIDGAPFSSVWTYGRRTTMHSSVKITGDVMHKSFEAAAAYLMANGYGFYSGGTFKNNFNKLVKVVKASSGYYVIKEA